MSTLLFGRVCRLELGVIVGLTLLGILFQNFTLIAISLLTFVVLIYFYRVPSFMVKTLGKNVLQSPSTGKIIKIQKKEKGNKIFIFLSPLDPHVQFVPFEGFVRKVDRVAGFNEFAGTFKENKNRMITDIETSNGDIITVTQNTGLVARRIVNFLEPGEWVKKGDQLGLIKFGSRVDVLVPDSFQLKVVSGQRVETGDVLAFLKRPKIDIDLTIESKNKVAN